MKTYKLCSLMVMLMVGVAVLGCGGKNTPITSSDTQVPTISTLPTEVPDTAKFKTAQEAIKWIAEFYKKLGIGIENFYGQLNSIYSQGVALGNIFIIARLSYDLGLDPKDILRIKEGDYGWTAVMEAFQIKGLGGYANLEDYLKSQKDSGRSNFGEPGTK